MRLAKYGKQLKDNYRAFKNKSESTDASSAKQQCTVYSNDPFRSRVAMDFTGSTGRIVDDPTEAQAIADSGGTSFQKFRPLRVSTRIQSNLPQVDNSVHAHKPWFHKSVSRDRAAALVKGYSKANGIFLVRESWSIPGSFVLTYKCNGTIYHSQIHPRLNERGDGYFYTLDDKIKFHDLIQLVEFYKLNSATLQTKLTHYVDNGLSSSSSSKNGSASTSTSPSSSYSPRKNDYGPKTSRS